MYNYLDAKDYGIVLRAGDVTMPTVITVGFGSGGLQPVSTSNN